MSETSYRKKGDIDQESNQNSQSQRLDAFALGSDM